MAIDLKSLNLSSKELFELAKQQEQIEKEDAERTEKINELKNQRESLIQSHNTLLNATDQAIRELTRKRNGLIATHEESLGKLDQEIRELEQLSEKAAKAEEEKLATLPATSEASANSSPGAFKRPKSSQPSGDIESALAEIMKKRPTISESMLKEQMKSRGFDTSNFGKLIDKLVRDKTLVSKGGGNYALGRKI